jgi:transposase
VLLMVDECHLLWGDACGYVWGPKGKRVEISITNIRERQTYYGALNLLTGSTVLWEAKIGNMEQTVGFLTYLRQVFQGRRLIICWDRAPYHRGHLVREYVGRVNGPACPEPERKIQLELFAPHAPVQNPIEDVWLRGKRAVREQWVDLQTFQDITVVFSHAVTHQQALCEKLNWYGREALIARRRELGFQWE